METCRFVVLRSPRGRLGSVLDVGKRLRRMRGRFQQWIAMRTGAQLPTCLHLQNYELAFMLERRVTVANLQRKLDAAEASAAREMNAMRLKLDAAEASAAALRAALVECRVAAADDHLHRMRAEQTEAPTALLDCSFASRRRASGLMPG